MKTLQSLLIGTTMAATTLATSTIAVSPAQATQLKGSIGLTGTAVFGKPTEASPLEDTLGFTSNEVETADGDFASLLGLESPAFSIETLNLTRYLGPVEFEPGVTTSFYNFTPSSNPFINFGNQDLFGTGAQSLTFNLNPGRTQRNYSSANSLNTINLGEVTGTFVYGGNIIGKGHLSASKSSNASSYEITLRTEPVPEPLTILGTGVALGFGVMFKKKGSTNLK
jgi:hypothetical protein